MHLARITPFSFNETEKLQAREEASTQVRLVKRALRLAGAMAAGLLAVMAGLVHAQSPNEVAPTATHQPGSAWPAIRKPSGSAPNVLLIMTDDVGFASTSTFGGLVPTPTFDSLAQRGAPYNGFNTTAICSPTRASLLTGRMPHNVEMGNVANLATGYTGYTSVMPNEAGTVAAVLRDAGYGTAMFGKWHIAPEWEQSSFGPFDRWPNGMGFDYFYGFLGGDTDQFSPALFENGLPIDPSKGDPNYILDRDLADQTIQWIKRHNATASDHPFFVYFAPGTAHSPHSAPKDWLEKFRGKFDMGWDRYRQEAYKRQIARGIIPATAELTPRPEFLPAWDSLTSEQKRVFSRQMEAFAAQLSFNDAQVGRILDSLEQDGELENTLVIFIQGDNGASAEGGQQGLFSEEAMINGYQEDFAYLLQNIDKIGGPKAHNHIAAPWAWAMSTPFQYYKQVASHAGGVRNGLVISWPGHISDPGKVRQQQLHVSDVAPTIYEVAGIEPPEVLKGVAQMPLDGMSFAYTLRRPSEPGHRQTIVYEMMQNLGIYHEGWTAGTRPMAAPWDIVVKSLDVDVEDRVWELYHIAEDFSQANDLASKYPEKLAAMKARFFEDAARGNILPIHGVRDGAAGRPSLGGARDLFRYTSRVTRVAEDAAPRTRGRSFNISADVTVSERGADGVLVTHGGRFGGYALYLKDGLPVFHYNAISDRQYRIAGTRPVAPGRHKIEARFIIDEEKAGSGGELTLLVDGQEVSRGRVENTYRTWISMSEGLDIGEDTLTPINDDYTISDSRFSGDIHEVRIELK